MSLAPRTPDLKANLAINNGTFGTLLSAASIGSIIMLLIGGQIVHTIGAKRALQIGSTIIAVSFLVLVHTKSPLIFFNCKYLRRFWNFDLPYCLKWPLTSSPG